MAKAYCTKEYGEDHCTHVTFGALSKQRSMRDKLNDSDDAGEDGAQVWCNPVPPCPHLAPRARCGARLRARVPRSRGRRVWRPVRSVQRRGRASRESRTTSCLHRSTLWCGPSQCVATRCSSERARCGVRMYLSLSLSLSLSHARTRARTHTHTTVHNHCQTGADDDRKRHLQGSKCDLGPPQSAPRRFRRLLHLRSPSPPCPSPIPLSIAPPLPPPCLLIFSFPPFLPHSRPILSPLPRPPLHPTAHAPVPHVSPAHLRARTCIHVYMYTCILHVYMYTCILHVYMYVCMYTCIHVCMYACKFPCIPGQCRRAP